MPELDPHINVFIAYSRKDVGFLEQLRTYLKPLDRTQAIKIWYDGEIVPGTVWEKDIKKNLHEADIILLLVSAYSLASDYFYDKEMSNALEKHHKEETIVVPVILSDCAWELTDLKDLQALPQDGKPIKSWPNESAAYANVVRGLYKSIDEAKKRKEESAKVIALKDQKQQEEIERQKLLAEQERKAKEEKKRIEAEEKAKAEKARLEREKQEKEKAERLEAQRQKRQKEEEATWSGLMHNESISGLSNFLKNYPQSKYAQDARDRLSTLNIVKKEKQQERNKSIRKWLVPLLLIPFVIWGITMLIPKNNKAISESELKIYQDEISKLWGFKKGDIIAIPAEFTFVTDFKEGIAKVEIEGRTILINEKGECVEGCPEEDRSQIEYEDLIRQAEYYYYDEKDYRNALIKYKSALGKVEDDSEAIQGLKNCESKLAEIDIINQRKKDEEQARRNDENAWREAKKANTITSYRRYLANYPNGQYKDDAEYLIKKLDEELKRKNTNSGTVRDRDGNSYRWLKMKDGKKWMTQNLNYKTTGSWCYGNKKANCDKYGRLYNWETAKKACASLLGGWRLPTDNEWGRLKDGYTYKALISVGNSGFKALLGGLRGNRGKFEGLGSYGSFWSATKVGANNASFYYFGDGKVAHYNYDKDGAMSCRCIKD